MQQVYSASECVRLIKNDQKLHLALPDLMATQTLASALAKVIMPGVSIYLHGNLGAGKTTLVRAMLVSLGATGAIKSPTYTLVESYALDGMDFYHFDLYRIADPSELDFIGIRDYQSANAITVFEWAEKGFGAIPLADLEITLTSNGAVREASIQANTKLGISILKSLTLGRQCD